MKLRIALLVGILTFITFAPVLAHPTYAATPPQGAFVPFQNGGTPGNPAGNNFDYVPIAPIPMGDSAEPATSGCLSDYINALFKLALAAGAGLAAIYIAIGGFEYIFSEATESKRDGRLRITHALYGLGILLVVTIILYIIGGPSVINLQLFSSTACGEHAQTATQPTPQTPPSGGATAPTAPTPTPAPVAPVTPSGQGTAPVALTQTQKNANTAATLQAKLEEVGIVDVQEIPVALVPNIISHGGFVYTDLFAGASFAYRVVTDATGKVTKVVQDKTIPLTSGILEMQTHSDWQVITDPLVLDIFTVDVSEQNP